MKRLEEAAGVLGFPAAAGQAGPEHRKRVRPIVLIHLCRHGPRPLIRSESYESCLIQLRNLEASVRSRGTEADGGRGRDLIETGLSEAADRLRAMAKAPASLMPLMHYRRERPSTMAAGELARCVERGGAALCGKMLPGLLLVKGFERARDTSRPMAARRPAAARCRSRANM